MRSRDAWLAVIAAALGVGEDACKRDVKDAPAAVREVPSASASVSVSVAAPAPSESASSIPIASASAAPSASASVRAEDLAKLLTGTPGPPATSLTIGTIGTGIGVGNIHNSCGATAIRPIDTAPTANVAVSAIGGVPGDERIVALMRGKLRACANQALKQNPNEQGKLLVRVTVGPNGDVTSTAIASNAGLSDASAQCMSRSMRSASFPASSAARTLDVTITQTRNNT